MKTHLHFLHGSMRIALAAVGLAVVACGGAPDPGAPSRSASSAVSAGDCLNLVAESGTNGSGPAGYTKCSDENGTCTFDQTVDVAYGANGGFVYRDGVTGAIVFSSAAFKLDPNPGVVKAGYFRLSGGPPGYTKCADEGGTCTTNRTVDLAYGAHGLFGYRCGVTGSFVANNATFGDPIYGSAKAAYYRNSGGPAGYTWCADEGGTCTLSVASDVAYGANGNFNTKYGVTGTITADNTTFGPDPIAGVAKSAYYKISGPRTGPDGYTWCADERGTCSFTRAVDVAYGGNGSFSYKYGITGTVRFENAAFGDPAYGVAKAGYYRPSAGGAADWSAQWIWLPQDRPNNGWLRLRKKVTLSQKPASASVRIAAENKYWLYVNGQLVVPDGGLDVRPDLKNTYYDSLDIAPYLTSGDNVIAALVWYKGGVDGYSQKMTSDGGFLFDAALSGATPAKIVSDGSWKAMLHPSFARTAQSVEVADFKWVQYPIRYDARSDPGDWTVPGFDDSAWPSVGQRGMPPSAPWNSLIPRTIPMLKTSGLTPYANQSALPTSLSADTTFTADVGNNVQGNAYLKVNAPAGVTVTIRMNQFYQEQYITKSGVQEYTTYQWQNTSGQPWSKHSVEYSFSNVSSTVQILDLRFRPQGYDTERVGAFSSGSPRLNTLWTKSQNTSYVCMRDQFYDCPDRERGQWWGDVSEQILYSFYLFDDKASLLARKGFRELLNTQKSDGSLYTTAPGTVFHLPDQNMAAVIALGQYYLYTGDGALVVELYPKVSTYIKQYVAGALNGDGMLILQSGPWNWIDWGSNLDIQTGSANTVANGLLIRLMETAKVLAQVDGNSVDVSYYQGLEDAALRHFNQYFWNSGSNAYVFGLLNGAQSATIDDRSNAWAVLAGAADPSRLPGVLNVLDTRLDAGPYQERYIEEAMFQMGRDSDAIARMLSYYGSNIDSWSQTMWEMDGTGGSNNHAWAASPAYLLSAFVAGVRPTAPGWSSYLVLPQMGTLTAVSATVPSKQGAIVVSHSQSDTSFTMNLTSPSGTQALVGIPRKQVWASISVNGSTIWSQGTFVSGVAGISGAGMDASYIQFNVAPGTWRFVASGSVLDRLFSLQVTTPGYTDRVLRHLNGLGVTSVVDTSSEDPSRMDASFWVRSGLANPACYSFESRNFPHQYLRHYNSRIRRDPDDGSSGFAGDATFCPKPGLSGSGTSFESYNYPGRYLRHVNAEVYIAQGNGPNAWDGGSAFNDDASWSLVGALWRSGVDLPVDQARTFQVVNPGLTSRVMRHQNGLVVTSVIDASDGGGKQDATFTIRRGLADSSCYSFQSVNFSNDYLRHSEFRLRKDPNDGSALFGSDATFCALPGLNGGDVSLAPYALPGKYVRHMNAEVWVGAAGGSDPGDGNGGTFSADATWHVIDPMAK